MRKRMDQRGVQYGPAFTGLAAVHTGERATGTVLAEVALPGPIRSQQMPTAYTRRCWMPVSSPLRLTRRSRRGAKVAGVAAGCPSATRLRPHPQRPLLLHTGDRKPIPPGSRPTSTSWTSTGRVLLAVRGLRLGTGVSEDSEQRSGAGERLLTIDWRATRIARGGTCRRWHLAADQHPATADVVATKLTDALKASGAQCTHHVLATARRPQLERRTAWDHLRCRWIRPVWSS